MNIIWLNGECREPENAIAADDRGLLLGDALFETILVKSAAPQFWGAHLDRLFAACADLGFACPYDKQILTKAASDLFSKNKIEPLAVLRISVSAGRGRGLINKNEKANWLMQTSEYTAPLNSYKLFLSDIIRPADITSKYKINNYFANIMARRAALANNADEAILLNQYGRVACAAAANIFIVKNKTLITPPISEGALGGIIRQQILQNNKAIKEAPITKTELEDAEMIFLTNSLIQIKPAYLAGTNSEKNLNKTQDFITKIKTNYTDGV